jgi:hypothetical protein
LTSPSHVLSEHDVHEPIERNLDQALINTQVVTRLALTLLNHSPSTTGWTLALVFSHGFILVVG